MGPYIDPEAKLLIDGYPLPNHTVTNTTQGNYNWITTNLVDNNLWQARARVDYAISEKNHFFADYSIESGLGYQPGNQYGPNFETTMGGLNSPGGGLESPIRSHVASFNFTSVLSPTLTNTFYGAGAYFSQEFDVREEAPYLKTPAVQASGNSYEGVYNNGSMALPSASDFGTDGVPFETIFDPTYGPVYTKKQIRTAGDDVSKLLGKHTLKGGLYYQWSSNPQKFEQNTNGSFWMYYLPGNWADESGKTIYNTDGNGYGGNYVADFMEGHLCGYGQVNIPVAENIYFWNLSGYAQDHYVVSPHLSVDYGIRLEHVTPWSDAHNIGIAVFDPAAYAKGFPSASPGVVDHKIDPSIPMSGIPGRAVWVEPRVGFAYNPASAKDTVIRGGVGLYRQHDSFNDVSSAVETGVGQRSYNAPTFTSLATVAAYQPLASGATGFAYDQNVNTLYYGDNRQPGVLTYNVAVDQQFPHGIVYEIAYAGNQSTDLMNYPQQNINAMPAGTLYKPQPDSRPDTAANAGFVYPMFTPLNGGSNTSLQSIDQEHIDSFRKYPLYDQVNAPRHNAWANYNALQSAISIQGRHGHVGANYTWSKALGTTSGNDPIVAEDNYNPLNFSRTNIFNINYDANTGTLSHKHFIAAAVNDWDISGYAGYQSGPDMPSVYGPNFSLGGTLDLPAGTVGQLPGEAPDTCPSNPCTFGIGSQINVGSPDINYQPSLVMSPQSTHKGQYANPNAFNLPPLGSNGTFHYPYFPAPAFFDTDLSVNKGFKVTESSRMTLRMSAFNVLNRANVSFAGTDAQEYQLLFNQTLNSTDLNTDLADARNKSVGFGTPTYKTGRRIVEMSLRYDF